MRFQSIAAVVLSALPLHAGALAQSPPQAEEPYFFTAFGREYVGKSAAILVGDVLSIQRIGATSKVLLAVAPSEWIHGGERHQERQEPRIEILSELAREVELGHRVLFFLKRPPGTRQYWVHGIVDGREAAFDEKRGLVKEYLRIAFLPAKERFESLLAYLESILRESGSGRWARWHALRELAEIALEYPTRLDEKHILRWKDWVKGSRPMLKTLIEVERDWRRLRKSGAKKKSLGEERTGDGSSMETSGGKERG